MNMDKVRYDIKKLVKEHKRGMVLFWYGVSAQLHGAATMAFYEKENDEQREMYLDLLDKKYELQDEVARKDEDIYFLESQVKELTKKVAILEHRVR